MSSTRISGEGALKMADCLRFMSRAKCIEVADGSFGQAAQTIALSLSRDALPAGPRGVSTLYLSIYLSIFLSFFSSLLPIVLAHAH